MAEKYIHRHPPCPAYEIRSFETWLEDMAAKGWFLEKDPFFAGFAGFHQSEPKSVRYRLQPAPKKAGVFARRDRQQDAIDLAAEYGWTFLGDHQDFFIFYTDDPNLPELDTDPQVQAMALHGLWKRKRNDWIAHLVITALYAVVFLGLMPVTFALETGWVFPVLLAVFVLNFILSLKQLQQLKQLRQSLLIDAILPQNTDYRQHKKLYFLSSLVSSLLVIAFFVGLVGMRLFDWEDRKWQPRTDPLPFATAEDLYPGSTFVAGEPWIIEKVDHVASRSTWLADQQISLYQYGSIQPDKQGLSLDVEYYDMRTEWLARQLYREIIRTQKTDKYYEPCATPDLSTAQEFAWYDFGTFLLLQEDDIVLLIRFSPHDDPMPMEQWGAVFAESIAD